MKPLIAFLLVLFNLPLAEAQINLVPNPSFEDTISCPSFLDNMQDVQDWSSYGNSSDYFNGCSSSGMNVPNAAFGFQFAHSGKAYSGAGTYLKGSSTLTNNYREFVGAELLSPLQIGTKYFLSFYAVSAESGAIGFFSNNLGLRFLNNSYDKFNPVPLDNFAHIKFDSLLTDTIQWHKISGSFVADSNYKFVCIGNFFDAINTDTLNFTQNPQSAYYYLDDVCVTIDSTYNETWTGIQSIDFTAIHVWPNPVIDYFQFNSSQRIDDIIVYDFSGRLVKKIKIDSLNGKIDLSELSKGLYIIIFSKGTLNSIFKILKF